MFSLLDEFIEWLFLALDSVEFMLWTTASELFTAALLLFWLVFEVLIELLLSLTEFFWASCNSLVDTKCGGQNSARFLGCIKLSLGNSGIRYKFSFLTFSSMLSENAPTVQLSLEYKFLDSSSLHTKTHY